MMKRTNQLFKIGIALLLFASSIYGIWWKNERLNDSQTASKKSYTKSSYFLNSKEPLVAYLYNNKESNDQVLTNSRQLCDYTKIPFTTIPIVEINNIDYEFPSTLKTLFINKTKYVSNTGIRNIIKFISNGGAIIITTAIEDERFNFLVGLKKEKSQHQYNITAKGVLFQNHFIPGLNDTPIYENLIHYGLNKSSFTNDITVLLFADNEPNYPVIINRKLGTGNVFYFNTTVEISKYERGLLFPCLLATLEGIPYPIANVNAIFLDDFPSPVYPFKKEPILSEYNLSSDAFVKDIWWPDMLTLAKKYNIQYTTTIIFDYEENSEPPFSYKQWNLARENFVPIPQIITQDVLDKNHELGIHGYNHVSLLKRSWQEDNMSIAFNTVKNMWEICNFGALPISYIPPSNYIDKQGVLTLHKSLPSLKFMCSLYGGHLESGGDREFNPEPYTDQMFDFPRITSGFYLDNSKKYQKESVFLYTGIWSHFVHPDDVYQIPDESNEKSKGEFSYRNKLELNWKKKNAQNLPGMYFEFEKIIQEHVQNFPFTTFPEVKRGGITVAQWREASFKHTPLSASYKVENLQKKANTQDWFVYRSKKNADELFTFLKKQSLAFTKIPFQQGYLVNIKTPSSELEIPYKAINRRTYNLQDILAAYEEHLNFKETPADLLSAKLLSLRNQLFNTTNRGVSVWKEYAKYCGWAKLEKQFWDDLENFYYLKQNYFAASLPNEMATIIWYPSEKSKVIWMERQLITTTDLNLKITLLKDYIKQYNSEENLKEIRKKLNQISKIHPTPENKTALVLTYLWRNDPEKFAVLNLLPVSKDYASIAKDLAWYFYEQKDLSKALEWAELSQEISIETQLYWLFENGRYQELSAYYQHYNYRSKEEEFLAKKTMIDLHLAKDHFLKAWNLAATIPPDHPEYNATRKKLNAFFLYQKRKTQKQILSEASPFLVKRVKDSLQRIIRLEENNTISTNTSIETNRKDIATFDQAVSYSMVAPNNNVHTFTLSNSLVNDVFSKDGTDIRLNGATYEFSNTRALGSTFNYSGKFGMETDNTTYYYSFGIKGSFTKENSLIALNYNIAPVRNNIAFSRYLYKNTLGCYFEKNFKNKINTTAYIESNLYTDYNADVTLSLSANYPVYKFNQNSIRTILESSHSLGSTDLDGIPYWMAKQRHFVGSGLQYQLNTDISKTYILVDGMYFFDSYSKSFSRFRAKVNFELWKYLSVHLNGELFQHNLYYSNSFNVGISYYLR